MGWARTFSIKVPVMTLRLIANTIKGKKEVVHFAARPRSLYQSRNEQQMSRIDRVEGVFGGVAPYEAPCTVI